MGRGCDFFSHETFLKNEKKANRINYRGINKNLTQLLDLFQKMYCSADKSTMLNAPYIQNLPALLDCLPL